jgi:hypothetical protein
MSLDDIYDRPMFRYCDEDPCQHPGRDPYDQDKCVECGLTFEDDEEEDDVELASKIVG